MAETHRMVSLSSRQRRSQAATASDDRPVEEEAAVALTNSSSSSSSDERLLDDDGAVPRLPPRPPRRRRRRPSAEPSEAGPEALAAVADDDDDDDDDEELEQRPTAAAAAAAAASRSRSSNPPTSRARIVGSFFVFGLINNVLYVIILSAALDLVPSTTPKGVVLFFNIAPSLMAKVAWPYLLKGRIRYRRRILACATCSFLGMLTIAFSPTLAPRLLGISLASFSSGLGELSFLQLSSAYPSALALGGFASGTGGAGLFGAGLWFLLKGWGVRRAMALASVLPVGMVAMLLLVLRPSEGEPAPKAVAPVDGSVTDDEDDDDDGDDALDRSTTTTRVSKTSGHGSGSGSSGLSVADKWRLARPLIGRFMLPLFAVYVFEYTINQGVAPTLLYDLPTKAPLRWLVRTPRDFYPLYQLTYQLFVFISRSSHLVGLPALPIRLLPLPSILQGGLLGLCLYESLRGPRLGLGPLLAVICLEGLCGGTAYVQTFHHVGRVGQVQNDNDDEDDADADDRIVDDVAGYEPVGGAAQGLDPVERRQQEREWRIGVVGASDSWGVLVASLVSMPLELALCQAQVDGGRSLCRTL